MKSNIAALFFLFSFLAVHDCYSQTIQVINSGTNSSLRGLSVVDDKVIWVSGSNGTVGLSLDGGTKWKWFTVHGFEKRDFRDIEAFDGATAIIMAVGEPACLLKTNDGGDTWTVVYENKKKGMFLDAIEFWNPQSGIVMGDPVDGRFFIARTFDEGRTWRDIPTENLPKADSGEACFAASGTAIRRLDRDEACFVTGGKRSRLFWKGIPLDLPIIQGKESAGANSIAVRDDKKLKDSKYFVVVGGDFTKPSSSEKNCFVTKDGGKTWTAPSAPPNGYRSCVEFITKKQLITCGVTGVDISNDGGYNWKAISSEGFHVCRKAKEGNAVFLAGANGRIARLVKAG